MIGGKKNFKLTISIKNIVFLLLKKKINNRNNTAKNSEKYLRVCIVRGKIGVLIF